MELIAFLVFFPLVYILIITILSKIFSFSKKARQTLYDSLHYTQYFCRLGHYAGYKKPVPGVLCQQCINIGLIRSPCPVNPSHFCEITRPTPPYITRCKEHGTFYGPWKYTVEGKDVGWREWIQINRYEPQLFPLPISKPIPQEKLDQAHPAEMQALIKDRLGVLYEELQRRIEELEIDSQNRQALQVVGIPISVELSVFLLILLALVSALSDKTGASSFLSHSIELTTRLTLLLEQLAKTLASLLISGMIVASVAISIIIVIIKRKEPGKSIDWFEVMGSIGCALFIELCFTRFLLREPLTIFGLLKSLALQIIPAVTFAFIYNNKYLKKGEEVLKQHKALKKLIRERVLETRHTELRERPKRPPDWLWKGHRERKEPAAG